MAGLSLKHIYKVYPGRKTSQKNPIKLLINKIKKKDAKPEVEKRSGNFVAVKDFSMEIEDGEFIVFVGPSGCGKSTTIRMIAGLEDITGGELLIDGVLVNDVAPKDRDIAMVFQNYALYPHMSVQKNIEFALKLRRIPVEKKDKDGNPVLAIDKKKIRELKEKIKSAQWEIDDYGDRGYLNLISSRKATLENRIKDILEGIPAEQKDEEGNPVLPEHIAAVKAVREKINAVEADAKEYNADAAAHKSALIRRKELLEKDLKNYLKKIPADQKDANGNPVGQSDADTVKSIRAKIKAVDVALEAFGEDEYGRILAGKKQALEEELKYYSETPVQAYSYKHIPKREIEEKVHWAAKILGIEELLDNKPAEMSGGQRQRVALGRAMVRGPKVFLLDEPLSNLDAKLRTTMRSEIVKLHNELKTTFIYVTHDQIEAMTMGTRIVVMKLGVVQQIDTPTNLYDFPDNKFVAGFIGTPQMNFFDVVIKKVGTKLETKFANGQTVSFPLSGLRSISEEYLDGNGHEVTLGIRGEHLLLAGDAAAKGKPTLETTLNVKEVLGNTTQLFVKLDGGGDYIVCVPERNNFASGDKISIAFKEQNIHLFDKATEKSIMGREFANKK